MVPRSIAACQTPQSQTPRCQTPQWKQDLADAFVRSEDLLTALDLNRSDIPDLDADPPDFRLLVPRGFAALMTPADAHDPLLRQVLPLGAERLSVAGFGTDPVRDGDADLGQGMLQKYAGRALLITTGACAVHCRYCFRRHFPYGSLNPAMDRTAAALAMIGADTGIGEVILSGGDPMMLSDDRLDALLKGLAGIAHVKRIRLHTRLPLVLPSRITAQLCQILTGLGPAVLVVVHANHPNELGEAAEAALRRMKQAGLAILNQSVLLRGVNDSIDVLAALSERLFECGALPYYLHQLDPVQGAAHFAVSDAAALELERALRRSLPGYLVPRLVREVPGAASKSPLIDFFPRKSVAP